MKKTALITSANSPKALTVIRSLGRKGICITAGGSEQKALSHSSRYTSTSIHYPSPKKEPDAFIKALLFHCKKNHPGVLIPVHSEDTLLIAKNRERFDPYTRVPLHDYERMRSLNDKAELCSIAQELDIPIPQTYILRDTSEITVISEKITYPAVIKLRDHTSSSGQLYARTPDELRSGFLGTISRYALTPDTYPLIQEYIQGTGCGVSFLYNQGEIRALFSHKRIREYPISGGPSTCRISIRNSKMELLGKRLLDHFSWHGVAMVEFIETADGKPILLEVNPRFWGSINQAVQSGVDFPHLLYQMATEGDIHPHFHYQEGIITRNSMLDAMSYIQSIRHHDPIDYRPWLQYPYHDDIFAADDPMPFLQFLKFGWKTVVIREEREHHTTKI